MLRSTWLLVLLSISTLAAAPLPRLKVSDNRRFLVTADGKPFFYLADTAWEIFHRLDRKQAAAYLDVRAAQGYNVIQAVALAEFDGITVPNAYGKLPFIDADPARPAIRRGEYGYWEHVDAIIDEANARGIYVALLPTWGAWVNNTGKDHAYLTPANAQGYGAFLGRRYAKRGIIWVLGGDRNPTGVEDTWRALARGIAIGVSGKEDYGAVLMTFHPRGGQTSSTNFHDEPWLSFNMQQDGHNAESGARSWLKVVADYQRSPVKPVLDGEPLYEDHPVNFNARQNGYSLDAHVRQFAYADVFSGACGHTYGNHAVWQMYTAERKPINGPLMYWTEAIRRPGAAQMGHLRALIESRDMLSRVPDQSIVVDALDGADHITATRGDGYLFVYSAQGRKFTVQPGKISGERLKAWWFNPRSGTALASGELAGGGPLEFTPPSEGFSSDWVLVLDDAAKNYGVPGASARPAGVARQASVRRP